MIYIKCFYIAVMLPTFATTDDGKSSSATLKFLFIQGALRVVVSSVNSLNFPLETKVIKDLSPETLNDIIRRSGSRSPQEAGFSR